MLPEQLTDEEFEYFRGQVMKSLKPLGIEGFIPSSAYALKYIQLTIYPPYFLMNKAHVRFQAKFQTKELKGFLFPGTSKKRKLSTPRGADLPYMCLQNQ